MVSVRKGLNAVRTFLETVSTPTTITPQSDNELVYNSGDNRLLLGKSGAFQNLFAAVRFTAPVNPLAGDMQWDSNNGRMLVSDAFGIQYTMGQGEQSVRAATLANIVLSGLQTIDGVVLAGLDIVLVKNQTAPADNGLYYAQAGAWTRAPGWTTALGVSLKRHVSVREGVVNGGSNWYTTFKASDTVGTTTMMWIYQGDLPGTVKMWASNVLPDGWMWCNGAPISKANYPAYDYYVGANYGSDATNNMAPYMTLNGFPRYGTPGPGGGSDTHNHTDGTLVASSHTHTSPAHVHAMGAHTHDLSTSNTGGSGSLSRVNASSTGGMVAAANTGSTTPGATGATAPKVTGNTDDASNVPAHTDFNFIVKIV